MKRRTLTLALFVAGTTVASATQTTRPSPPVLGVGGIACSVWVANATQTATGAVTSRPPDPVQMSWVLGYTSAVATTVTFAREPKIEFIQGVMTGYCVNNPTATLADAAHIVVQTLQAR